MSLYGLYVYLLDFSPEKWEKQHWENFFSYVSQALKNIWESSIKQVFDIF